MIYDFMTLGGCKFGDVVMKESGVVEDAMFQEWGDGSRRTSRRGENGPCPCQACKLTSEVPT